MKILFLSPRQCWPPHSGAKLREYHFARALGERSRLTYAYFADPGEPRLTAAQLPFCEQIVAVPKPAAYARLNLVRGLLGRWPLSVLNYTSAEMTSALARLPVQEFDLVHVDSIHMLRYADRFGPSKAIYNWHNIESELMRRYSQTVPSRVKRIYAYVTARKLEKLERRILGSALGHIVCSERERLELEKIAPRARIAVVENGVDIRQFAGGAAAEALNRIVFVGKMDYYPNVEAASGFVSRIWPKIRERWPSMRLSIVGSDPVPAVKALQESAGVEVTGTVPDVGPYYRNSLAAIVPLRTGGGTRLKILEAMAARTPVISTAAGAEGLSVTPGRDILIAGADSPQEWLEQLARLAESPQRRDEITRAAFQLVESRYDWTGLEQQLWSTYENWSRSAA